MLVELSRSKNASAVAVTASTEVPDSSFRFLFNDLGVSEVVRSDESSRELADVSQLELGISWMSLFISSVSRGVEAPD